MEIEMEQDNSYDLNEEEWRPVIGYEDAYLVSNFGRVKSLGRYDNIGHYRPERILHQPLTPAGYPHVHLSKNGVARWMLVHRLVAEAFIYKPEGCDIVNHLDNNPKNNHSDNLEWTTYKGNMQWATKQGRMHYNPENLAKAVEAIKKPVVAIKDGAEFMFESQAEAVRQLGLSETVGKHIAQVCRKDRGYKTAGGYEWRYLYE